MDSRLLEYYQRELAWLREMGAEFAAGYPTLAGKLGMGGNDVADPYVERLLEGFAFLTSRIQLKMDEEFPQFSRQMLEMLYPNSLAGIPSMAIVELQPDAVKGDISQGFPVPRGTILDCRAFKNRGITCRYRTAHDVTLQPLLIDQVSLGGVPADLSRASMGSGESVGALRIRLRCFENVALQQLCCDHLTFYLAGDDVQAQQLLELLIQHTRAVCCISGDSAQSLWLDAAALRHEGFDGRQALLPRDPRNLDGYRLVQEYFHFPRRFHFFSVHGLQPLLARGGAQRQLEIVLLLDKSAPDLERRINAEHLALNCTPVINLFERAAERIQLDERQTDYHLVVDKLRPLDYEIHSVLKLHGSGYKGDNGYQRVFKPIYAIRSEDGADGHAWYSLRREQHLWNGAPGSSGARSGYSGSEVFVSLADEAHPPWHDELKFLNADVLCSNGDLPLQLRQAELGDMVLQDSLPVRRVLLRHGPSAPRPSLSRSHDYWQLISQLQMNFFSLMDCADGDSGDALRRLLALQAGDSAGLHIAGILACHLQPCHRLLAPPAMYARGTHIRITVDEPAFCGASPWLLGSVLARLFRQLAGINSFTETTLVSPQRGIIGHWPAQTGMRNPL